MTIHKAKGLEFDTVIVPGLDRPPHAADKPLFAWKSRADGTLMMAPVRAAGEAREAAYDYLCALDDAAGEHEAGRLLYVATTRAARCLHLLGCAGMEWKAGAARVRPPSRALAARQGLGHGERRVRPRAAAARARRAGRRPAAPGGPGELVVLARKALDVEVPATSARATAVAPADEAVAIEFSWVGETARHVGIITHRWLQRIAADGVQAWDAERVDGLGATVEADLARRGIPPVERADARERVLAALEGALADPRGRWVLEAHDGARSEHRLRIATPSGVKLVVIDRTFVDRDGQRWIVDYKTSAHEGADPEALPRPRARALSRAARGLRRGVPRRGRGARPVLPAHEGLARDRAVRPQPPSCARSRSTVSVSVRELALQLVDCARAARRSRPRRWRRAHRPRRAGDAAAPSGAGAGSPESRCAQRVSRAPGARGSSRTRPALGQLAQESPPPRGCRRSDAAARC